MMYYKSDSYLQDLELIRKINSRDECAVRELFVKYKPLVNKLWKTYYLHNIDIDDWFQEATLVMLNSVQKYDCEKMINFGVFFKMGLKNKCFDMIRKSNAQKRVPISMQTSFNSDEQFLSDTIADSLAVCPEERLILQEKFIRLISVCSEFEKNILIALFNRKRFSEIALEQHCDESKVNNAFERCRVKFNKLTF
ncbi:sigma-70 family RNA polymerase sigma factor [Apilactobacillus xinyiensis]|uniref:sigma-70 family RNA polymerase sigma factor n=1 Tax=Apilactobacillus xinyiensis TaxID=2841032 RepID=UPI001C7CE54E|nr:sigma-70 family RNA polymerase sigma factor [Apilactobacillus xinyiensis]